MINDDAVPIQEQDPGASSPEIRQLFRNHRVGSTESVASSGPWFFDRDLGENLGR